MLTGDRLLRRVAMESDLRVHGVLRVVDELWKAGGRSEEILLAASQCCGTTARCFLPDSETALQLRRIRGLS